MNILSCTRRMLVPCGIPLAWRQLSSDRKRMVTALAGVSFGVMLMLFQQGIYVALMKMVVRPIEAMDGELTMVSRNFEYFCSAKRFPERRIYQALADPDVESVSPVALQFLHWRNPDTGIERDLVAFGIYPGRNPFRLPEVVAQAGVFTHPQGILYDRMSKRDFGPVAEIFQRDGPFAVEISGRRAEVQGLFAMGETLASSAHIITGMENFLRLSGIREHQCSVGVIRLQPGADPPAVAARLKRLLPSDVDVIPREELARREQQYWAKRTPVGFITIAGMIIAMVVGSVIVYQILYTDVNDHLREYATLKAMGMPGRFFTSLVVQESAILLGIGFLPGLAIAGALFREAESVAGIPTRLTWGDTSLIFGLAAVMCLVGGLLATRRLRSADPADIFS